MATLLLIVHLMVAIALVCVILLQRSEGGALGIGGGGAGGFLTGRGQANLLTRVTAILAVTFIATSLILAIIATYRAQPTSILDQPAAVPTQPQVPTQPVVPPEPRAPLAD